MWRAANRSLTSFCTRRRRWARRPKAAIVIEDSPPGVVAARAAGAKVIGFVGGSHVAEGHGEKLTDAGANAIAASWKAVADLLGEPHRLGL